MASPQPVLLLSAPASRVLLSAHLQPRSSEPTSHSVSSCFRKFVVDLVKQLWSDPKRVWKFLNLSSPPARPRMPCRLLRIPEAVAFPSIRRLLDALLRKATLQVIVVATATLMAIHLFPARPAEEDDEQTLLQRRLPLFVRDGVRRIIAPRCPVPRLRWPPHSWTVDALEALRFDTRRRDMDDSDSEQCRVKAQSDGVKKTEQAIYRPSSDLKKRVSMLRHIRVRARTDGLKIVQATYRLSSDLKERVSMLHHLRGRAHTDGLKTELAISSVATASNSTTKFEATHDEFCNEKPAHVHNSIGKTLSQKEKNDSKMLAGEEQSLKIIKVDKPTDRSEATRSKLQMCLAALPRREEPVKEIKQKYL